MNIPWIVERILILTKIATDANKKAKIIIDFVQMVTERILLRAGYKDTHRFEDCAAQIAGAEKYAPFCWMDFMPEKATTEFYLGFLCLKHFPLPIPKLVGEEKLSHFCGDNEYELFFGPKGVIVETLPMRNGKNRDYGEAIALVVTWLQTAVREILGKDDESIFMEAIAELEEKYKMRYEMFERTLLKHLAKASGISADEIKAKANTTTLATLGLGYRPIGNVQVLTGQSLQVYIDSTTVEDMLSQYV